MTRSFGARGAMRITRVEPLQVAPNLLVRVRTDEGIVGYGECSPMNNTIVAAHVEHALAPIVVGRDPFDTEALVEQMFVSTYKIAGQALAMAVSGIEMALWDVQGKALDVPIYKLLG